MNIASISSVQTAVRSATSSPFDHVFHEIMNQAKEFTSQAHNMDRHVQGYAEGKSDIAALAPAMSHFLLKVESVKAITEGVIRTWDTLQKTSI